jgi:hypothetical protein
MSDTWVVSGVRRLAALFLLLLCAGCAAPLAGTSRVVWVRENRAYVALRDSTALAAGDRVRFERGGKTVAGGIVTRIERGEMAQVTLTSGSLGEDRDLARTTVLPERSPLVAPSSLRVGLPSAARTTAFFSCGQAGVESAWPAGAYRTDASSPRLARFLRNPAVSLDPPWPDTLIVRFYDENADEEIALERGELEVAVFWPGELSSHMRTSPRWRDPLMGVRSRGAVVLLWGDTSSVDPAALEREKNTTFDALNRDVFHGDLLPVPWNRPPADSARSASDAPRIQVDPRCPGRAELQRYLDRRAPAAPKGLVRLKYSELVRFSPGGFQAEDVAGIALFAIRCPIVCAPALRPYVAALGASRLADLIACMP